MVDTRPFQRVSEATDQVADVIRDTQQAAANQLTTFQQANLKFTQKSFSNWRELVNEQFKSMQYLQQQWERQYWSQQDVFLNLLSCSWELSMHLFFAPFALACRGMDEAEDRLRHEREQRG